MFKIFLVLAAITLPAMAVVNVGEKVANSCWTDVNGKQVCIDDYKDQVKVLIHSAGWCGPCKAEMKELAKKVSRYASKKVVFFSLSSEGWKSRSKPDTQFLFDWIKMFDLNNLISKKVQIVVAAAPGDFGKDFFKQLAVPTVAVLAKDNTLLFKEQGAEVADILAQVDSQNP